MNEFLLMSIKTKYANLIFNGTKTYEFRRKSIGEKNLNKKIFVYSSEESREVVGYFIVDEILCGSVYELLDMTSYPDREGIINYFNGCEECYALHISEYYRFLKPIKISEIKEFYCDFVIPQFYRYLKVSESIFDVLMNREVYHNMNLQNRYFDYIKSGSKRIELRLNDDKRKNVKVGDKIIFNKDNSDEKLITRVTNIHKSDNFENLFNNFDISILADKSMNKEELLLELGKFYTYEKQTKYGVLGIEVELEYVLSSELCDSVIDEIYGLTCEIEKYYSDYRDWFYNKQVCESGRKIFYIKKDNLIIGIASLKLEESKLCTIFVHNDYRNLGLSDLLLFESFKYLGTSKPYLTCNRVNYEYLKPLVEKYNWKHTSSIGEEMIFNE